MTCTILISARCVQWRRQKLRVCAPDRVHFRGYTPYLTLYVHGRRYDVHARPRVSCVSCVRAHATQRHTDHRVACDCETAVAVHSTFIALTLSASGDQTSNDHIYSMCGEVHWPTSQTSTHTHSPDPDPVKHVLTRTTAHQRPSAAAVPTVTLLVSAQMQCGPASTTP